LGIGTVPVLDQLVVRSMSALGEYGLVLGVCLPGVVRGMEDPGGDV
jgi:hypothetical protein